ncbi:MAG: hydroxymethylglutaryl-CoA synthase [Chloroflexi bacterium]|nr:hydroxymethylglutaryl-CoA synthase [Chloroflexota bacterium]MBI3930767.1 hydroxymethylglutaryl-CoA synthase [Chloroflexota bacterium]
MVGITSAGAYVPIYRLARGDIARVWAGGRGVAVAGERAVANFDEDTISMAVEASIDCLKGIDREQIDGLYFASTTAPYREKQSATMVAEALDLRREIFTADFTDSLRAGTNAMRAAIDAVKAGSAKKVLVTAADCRLGALQSEYEQNFGDGAVAILISNSGVIASVEGSYSHSNDIIDLWRTDTNTFVNASEDRFSVTYGYLENVQEGVSKLLERYNLSPKDFAKAALYAFDARRHLELARNLGFDAKTQLQDSLFNTVGNTGAAYALMILAATLEEAKAGDRILFTSYGDGCDAYILQATDKIGKLKGRKGIKGHVASKLPLPDYTKYLRYRSLLGELALAGEPVATINWRERNWSVRCHGSKCRECGKIEWPIQRICAYCGAKDNYDEVRLSDKKLTLTTFSKDSLARSVDPPIIVCIASIEGGGRFYAHMTDRDPDKVEVGMPLELTFRRLYSKDDIHTYSWKMRPIR